MVVLVSAGGDGGAGEVGLIEGLSEARNTMTFSFRLRQFEGLPTR